MTLDQVKEVLCHFKAKGFKSASILAEGEVLVYPHYQEAVSFMYSLGFPKDKLITNGILIDKHLDFIIRHHPSVLVSIDGPNFEEYHKIRGSNENTFNHILENVRALTSRKKKTMINFVVQKANMHCADEMIELAASLKVHALNFRNFHPVGTGSDLVPLYSDDPESVEFAKKIQQENKKRGFQIKPPILHRHDGTKFHCEGMLGKTVIVSSNGDFQPCCQIPSAVKWGNFWDDPDAYLNAEAKIELVQEIKKATCWNEIGVDCKDCPRLKSKRN